MAKVMLTGATGYLGKRAAKRLVREGHSTYAIVRSESRLERLKKSLDPGEADRLIGIQGDLSRQGLALKQADLNRLLDTEVIIHAGGPMDVDLDKETARRVFLNGASELMDLVEQIHRQGGKLRHLIHVAGYMSPFDEGNWRKEPDAYQLIDRFMEKDSAYEKMKFLADLLIRQRAARLGIPLSVVNPSVVIGDRQTGETEQTGGLGILVDAVRRGLMPVVPGGAGHWIPMTTTDDVAELMAVLARMSHPSNGTYAVMEERSDSPNMKELTQLIARELRVRPPQGSVSASWLRTLMSTGLGKLTGISAHSLSFVSRRDFDTQSFRELKSWSGMSGTDLRRLLPAVIADLDDRLSRTDLQLPEGWTRERKGDIAALRRGVPKAEQGEPWVFLHGMFSRSDDLLPIASKWENEAAWLFDLPGLGRSPRLHQADVLGGTVAAVAAALLNISGKIRLVGHSIGALVALQVYRMMPDKISKLILLQPPTHSPEWPVYAGPLPWILKAPGYIARTFFSASALQKFLVQTGSFGRASDIPNGYIEKLRSGLTSPRIRKTNADWMRFLRHDIGGFDWEGLDRPEVAVIWGTQDKAYRRPETTRPISIPYGHQFPIQHPGLTAEMLKQIATGV